MLTNLQLSPLLFLRIETDKDTLALSLMEHERDTSNFDQVKRIVIPRQQVATFAGIIAQAYDEFAEQPK